MKTIANNIFLCFLSPQPANEINVSYTIRSKIRAVLEEEELVDSTLYDEAFRVITGFMKFDSLPRFMQAVAFKEHAGTIRNIESL